MLCLPLAFWACGDDSSSGASDDDYSADSSSSVIPGTDRESSGSENLKTAWDYLNPDIDYGEFTDARDGQTYRTVKIGEQIWMAQNLNYAYNEPTVTEDSSSFCFGNAPDSCAKHGRLYLWSAAMDSAAVFSDNGKGCGYGSTCSASGTVRGVCPEGWHLPSYDEWDALLTAVGGSSTAGMMLKSQTGWKSYSGVPAGSDAYGFSALPAGYRHVNNGDFHDAGYSAFFRSSSEGNSDGAYSMFLYYDYEDACLGNYYKLDAFSVRCLKNSN